MKTENLLNLRFSELRLRYTESPLSDICQTASAELAAAGLLVRPNFWISTSFFVPDGMTGIALPFYLFHPRLRRLEHEIVGELEGGTTTELKMLLRHEMGHVVDNAYYLRRKKRRQRLFGPSSKEYNWYYRDKPYSKNYVRHIEDSYAQSHPDEDFAETFAVWLSEPDWHEKYRRWGALKKLEYMDELMGELAGKKPVKKTRSTSEGLRTNNETLREHYHEKLKYLRTREIQSMDPRLTQVFKAGGQPAEVFVSEFGKTAARKVSEKTGIFQYKVNQVVKDVMSRCRHLDLTASEYNRSLEKKFLGLLEFEARRYQKRGLYRKTR